MKVNICLCNEFEVACEICHCNNIGKRVSLGSIDYIMRDILTHGDVVAAIKTLVEWGIVRILIESDEHGDDEYVLVISDDSKHIVNELLEIYWMPEILNRGE